VRLSSIVYDAMICNVVECSGMPRMDVYICHAVYISQSNVLKVSKNWSASSKWRPRACFLVHLLV